MKFETAALQVFKQRGKVIHQGLAPLECSRGILEVHIFSIEGLKLRDIIAS
jgi:hypothetical protein